MTPLTAVSLFAGCGGLDSGLERAGVTVIKAYEWDAAACDAYERVTGKPVQQTDLAKIDPHSLPDADMIIGGPPCQEFSQGNVLGSIEGVKNLWPATLAIVKTKRPSLVLFENVTGLVFLKRNRAYFYYILDTLTSFGYRVEYRVLNAADYGVPQTRQRVFIVGRLDGQAWRWPIPSHTETVELFTPQWISWRESLPIDWHTTAEKGVMPEWVTRRPTYRDVPQNALFNCKDMFKERLHRDASEPAFTLTGECIKRTRVILGGIVYRANTLAMTRLQTLPDIDMPAHVIGNAVPPLLSQRVFEAAFEMEAAHDA